MAGAAAGADVVDGDVDAVFAECPQGRDPSGLVDERGPVRSATGMNWTGEMSPRVW